MIDRNVKENWITPRNKDFLEMASDGELKMKIAYLKGAYDNMQLSM